MVLSRMKPENVLTYSGHSVGHHFCLNWFRFIHCSVVWPMSCAISSAAWGWPTFIAFFDITSRSWESWSQQATSRPIVSGSSQKSPKPPFKTISTFPASWPGRWDVTIMGKPTAAASAIDSGRWQPAVSRLHRSGAKRAGDAAVGAGRRACAAVDDQHADARPAEHRQHASWVVIWTSGLASSRPHSR